MGGMKPFQSIEGIGSYLLSLPERVVRSTAAVSAGLLRELSDVALPAPVRRTKLYRTMVRDTLRFLIEEVGEVEGTYASEGKLSEQFAMRRAAGNGVEMIGILAFRASPVWVLAALADLSGAGRRLVSEIAESLKREGLLDPGTKFETVDHILDGLEMASDRMVDAVNTPPLDVAGLRKEWNELRRAIKRIPPSRLPSMDRLRSHWRELRETAASENHSVFQISSLLAVSATQQLPKNIHWLSKSGALAVRRTGELLALPLLEHYSSALGEIRSAGFQAYWTRQFGPYLRAAAAQFSRDRSTLTARLLGRGKGVTMNLLSMSPQEFVRTLQGEKIRRFYFVYDAGSELVKSSHPRLRPIADFLGSEGRDFMRHEGLFFQVSREHATLQGAFVHRTIRGQAAGGVRYWHYDTVEEYLRDGLRLAVGMTRKNALAGIWWGGGKGVMARNPAVERDDPSARKVLYREYGELITSIRGCYVTAEDVGTFVDDMAHVFATTRFTTCIPPALGGSGNPSVPTARGVISGMEAALEFAGTPGLEGKTVAVQGMGNVGEPLIRFLMKKNVGKVIACDINPSYVERGEREFGRSRLEARLVTEDDTSIFGAQCDILAPCATGAILNPRAIELMKARIVCGAANNQLEDPDRDDRLLHEKGVLYVPDFLTNRMGIVNCADEGAGSIPEDPVVERHLSRAWEFSIHQMCLKVLGRSRSTGEPPSAVATAMADELSMQPHPVFGHRGQQIIEALVAENWEGT
jgi:glutamate dehydrogenase/leucine dehydrogenase